MKKLISFIVFAVPGIFSTGSALAHPGHTAMEQVHGFLHAEHLSVLIGIIGVLIASAIIKKRF